MNEDCDLYEEGLRNSEQADGVWRRVDLSCHGSLLDGHWLDWFGLV